MEITEYKLDILSRKPAERISAIYYANIIVNKDLYITCVLIPIGSMLTGQLGVDYSDI